MGMSTTALPICLIPVDYVAFLSTDELERFEFLTYSDAPQAWKFAEQNEIACFVSDHRLNQEVLCGLLSALQLLSPDFVHLHAYRIQSVASLLSVINRAGAVRLIPVEELESRFPGFLADALLVWMRNRRKDQKIAELIQSNEQYEFMLRQSLLS
jgi:hypothetical protein